MEQSIEPKPLSADFLDDLTRRISKHELAYFMRNLGMLRVKEAVKNAWGEEYTLVNIDNPSDL